MKFLAYTPPKFRWKAYFGFLAVLTASGIPTQSPTMLIVVSDLVAFLGLAGLFGYAWSVKLPGSRPFWLAMAIASLGLMTVSTMIMLRTPPGQRLLEMPLALTFAFLVVAALSLPQTVALFRYAEWTGRSRGSAFARAECDGASR